MSSVLSLPLVPLKTMSLSGPPVSCWSLMGRSILIKLAPLPALNVNVAMLVKVTGVPPLRMYVIPPTAAPGVSNSTSELPPATPFMVMLDDCGCDVVDCDCDCVGDCDWDCDPDVDCD